MARKRARQGVERHREKAGSNGPSNGPSNALSLAATRAASSALKARCPVDVVMPYSRITSMLSTAAAEGEGEGQKRGEHGQPQKKKAALGHDKEAEQGLQRAHVCGTASQSDPRVVGQRHSRGERGRCTRVREASAVRHAEGGKKPREKRSALCVSGVYTAWAGAQSPPRRARSGAASRERASERERKKKKKGPQGHRCHRSAARLFVPIAAAPSPSPVLSLAGRAPPTAIAAEVSQRGDRAARKARGRSDGRTDVPS